MLRFFVILFGLALVSGSGVAFCAGARAGAIAPLIMGALLLIGTVFERHYRNNPAQPTEPDWAPTGERFADPEQGVVDVWYNKTTGERRYVPSA